MSWNKTARDCSRKGTFSRQHVKSYHLGSAGGCCGATHGNDAVFVRFLQELNLERGRGGGGDQKRFFMFGCAIALIPCSRMPLNRDYGKYVDRADTTYRRGPPQEQHFPSERRCITVVRWIACPCMRPRKPFCQEKESPRPSTQASITYHAYPATYVQTGLDSSTLQSALF